MKNIGLIIIVAVFLFPDEIKAGEPLYWLTYGHSKYVYSPGAEACYQFRPYLGINLGISVYLQYPDLSRVTNITHNSTFNFHNANLGLSGYVFRSENHSAGVIAGFKLYYGPDYRKLTWYGDGGYYIYHDASFLYPDYGPDLGLFYNYRKLSLLGKWDFARNRFRLGIGYRFHMKQE